MMPC